MPEEEKQTKINARLETKTQVYFESYINCITTAKVHSSGGLKAQNQSQEATRTSVQFVHLRSKPKPVL